jgi:exosortase/archaeosortase family protein
MKTYLNILIRYFLVVLLGLGNLYIFYQLFSPITIQITNAILSLFYDTTLRENFILINSIVIELIPACMAGSAYYLLTALNLLTPMKIRKRINSLTLLLLVFLVLNILRIVIFSFLALNGASYFSILHEFFWYFGSIILVIILWFVNIKLFKIQGIPVFTDFKYLFFLTKSKKNKK